MVAVIVVVTVSRISYVRVVVLVAVKPITRQCHDNNKQTRQQTSNNSSHAHAHKQVHTHTYVCIALGERTLMREEQWERGDREISLQFNRRAQLN